MSRDELAIVRTVMYAALFDYPLTLEQLHQSLIASSMTPEEILSTYCTSVRLRAVVEYRDGFFFPASSGALVAERRRREARPGRLMVRPAAARGAAAGARRRRE